MPLNDAAVRGVSVAPATSAPGLSPKAQRTRRRLVEGARAAFELSGSYVDTRVSDIVRESGVAYGSFYTYFGSKEELFHELAVTVVDEMYADSTSAYRGQDPIERIDSANRRLLLSYRRHATMLAVIDQAAALYPAFRNLRKELRARFVQRIASSLRRLIAQGRADARLDPEVAAQVLVSMTDNFGQLWSAMSEQFDEEKALQTLGVLWANAVGATR